MPLSFIPSKDKQFVIFSNNKSQCLSEIFFIMLPVPSILTLNIDLTYRQTVLAINFKRDIHVYVHGTFLPLKNQGILLRYDWSPYFNVQCFGNPYPLTALTGHKILSETWFILSDFSCLVM